MTPTDLADEAIEVTVNGERRSVAAGTSLADLLSSLGLDPRMIVVERNREILRERSAFAGLALREGDELELVHFVGGG
ncbi:MAG TPA: sulfur carrier protein ThiS [Gemmatimonadaceae bacterium]|nr:sulfur carrier protein ThiS [Gemmatimonadaceae bacterium]